MSLDGAFLHLVKNELLNKNLVGARVDKIHQPSREEIVITLRGFSGAHKLLMSANPASARICLTEGVQDNPASPPMFCMLLRKHLSGGKLLRIEQDGLERILCLDFSCVNEIGDEVENRLSVELMGRCSNIILLSKQERGYKVIDSIKRITDDISSVRRILPGIAYELPPREDRLDLRDCTPDEAISRLLPQPEQRMEKAMLRVFEGISPVVAREAAFYTARDCEALCGCLAEKERADRFGFFLGKLKKALNENAADYHIICDLNGKYKDFTFFAPEQYGTSGLIRPAESASALLDGFFGSRVNAERMKQRSGDLLKLILNTYQRTARKLELQRAELQDTKDREVFRVRGDLLSANLYRMEKGMNEITVDNYLTGQPETIKLDVRLTPSQNAQKCYAEYKKLDTAEKMLSKLIKQGEEELAYLDSVFDAAGRATMEAELVEIKQELYETGYLHKGRNQKAEKAQKPLKPLKFRSDDGFDILVGRNNLQNDRLTLKTAKPDDMWLHTHDIAGAHVIICAEGREIPDSTLLQAAILAATYSKGADGTKIPVDYTRAKFVKKPSGAKPGMVIFVNNKTLLADPDKDIAQRLTVKG